MHGRPSPSCSSCSARSSRAPASSQSVHAFEKDPLSLWLFLAHDGRSLRVRRRSACSASRGEAVQAGDEEFESLTSKEAAYYFNNVLMLSRRCSSRT